MSILFSVNSFCQTDSVIYFFDTNGGLCEREKAYYIAKGIKGESVKLRYNVITTGVAVMEASYSDTTLSVKNGYFALYAEDGSGLIKKGNYIDNKEDGYWIEWSQGLFTDSVLFENGEIMARITWSYHTNGKLSGRVLSDSRNKVAELTFYDEEGNIKRSTSWINGSGDQVYYYPNRSIKMIETYKDRKKIAVKHFLPDGKELSEKAMTKKENKLIANYKGGVTGAPSYPGGSSGFDNFFRQTFKAPQNQGTDEFPGSVTVSFYLDKAGFANNIKVAGLNNRNLEIEILTVFRRMVAWNMNGHTSFGPIVYTIIL
jgi:antitoxin component YwqK of YwqJK toxin-antitoxin module